MRIVTLLLAVVLSGCATTTPNNSSNKPEEIPKLANLEQAKWNGRSLSDFFEDVFDQGMPASTFEGEVFAADDDMWEIQKSSDGITLVGVRVPTLYYSFGGPAVEGTVGYDQSYQEWANKFPFPVSEARFALNPFSEPAYIKGQKLRQYVMFMGLNDGFTSTDANGDVSEISLLCFVTAQGVDDMEAISQALEE